jgi:16S rRNA (adenine1518-N6/adenine1519-N6)-dimethyltransferase
MVQAGDLSPGDTVIEIGPGLGILTQRLVQAATRVIAVELDGVLADALPDRLGKPSNLRVVHADALQVDLGELVAEPYVVVASLPYHVASPILFRLLFEAPAPTRIVAMLQHEVAQRITATAGALTYLGGAVQLVASARLVRHVPAGAFYPVPKVRSAIVRLDRRPEPVVDVPDVPAFVAFLRAGFTQSRKQLHNSLAQGLGQAPAGVQRAATAAGIDATQRPGTLTLEQWARLYEHVRAMGMR